MVEFTITGEALWERMERAVEKVNERLRRTVRILEEARIPYAVVGGHAVRAWVAQVDEAALRTTQDVDILVRAADFSAMDSAMRAAGFHHRQTEGLDMYIEDPDASARNAVYILICGRVFRGAEPYPDIEPATRASDFQTIPLETLVRMKLSAFRLKDRVHLLDMISLGMIDAPWLDRYPEVLRVRLQELLDNPDS
jgi:hypothetical protein